MEYTEVSTLATWFLIYDIAGKYFSLGSCSFSLFLHPQAKVITITNPAIISLFIPSNVNNYHK